MNERKCDFCGQTAKRLRGIGIAFGIAGEDYDFCYKCLKSMTADKFWRKLFQKEGYRYPPKFKDEK